MRTTRSGRQTVSLNSNKYVCPVCGQEATFVGEDAYGNKYKAKHITKRGTVLVCDAKMGLRRKRREQ